MTIGQTWRFTPPASSFRPPPPPPTPLEHACNSPPPFAITKSTLPPPAKLTFSPTPSFPFPSTVLPDALQRFQHFMMSQHPLRRLVCVRSLTDIVHGLSVDEALEGALPMLEAAAGDEESSVRDALATQLAPALKDLLPRADPNQVAKVMSPLSPLLFSSLLFSSLLFSSLLFYSILFYSLLSSPLLSSPLLSSHPKPQTPTLAFAPPPPLQISYTVSSFRLYLSNWLSHPSSSPDHCPPSSYRFRLFRSSGPSLYPFSGIKTNK